MDQHLINRIVEAALLATSEPLPVTQLYGLFQEEDSAPDGSVEIALEYLREGCAERGVDLVEVASGYRFQVKQEVHGWVSRMWAERKTKYTRATLETLALIAYRQPITRGEIEQVRGVAVSSNIIQALEEREWIRVVGHRDVPGRPALFGTTKGFLDYFGLKSLDALPPLSELRDIGELEPQLLLGSAPEPIAGLDLSNSNTFDAPESTKHITAIDATTPSQLDETGSELPQIHQEWPDSSQALPVSTTAEKSLNKRTIPETNRTSLSVDSNPDTQEDDAHVVSSEQQS